MNFLWFMSEKIIFCIYLLLYYLRLSPLIFYLFTYRKGGMEIDSSLLASLFTFHEMKRHEPIYYQCFLHGCLSKIIMIKKYILIFIYIFPCVLTMSISSFYNECHILYTCLYLYLNLCLCFLA